MAGLDAVSRIVDNVVQKIQDQSSQLTLRQGRIETVNGDGTVDITLGGSVDVISSVHRLASYTPTQFDTIWVLINGTDPLVIGTLA